MIAVLKHELRLYFHSLTAYVFGAFLLAFVGIGAMLYNIQAAVSNFEFVLSFGSLVFVVIVPILTMRVIAEERKQKTDQLLYALPITTTQVILGKYLALLVVYLIPLALISLYPLLFAQFGEVYLPTSYGSILAFFVLGAALIALGVFISSLTDNQGFAAGIGIAAILLNYYSVSLSEYISSTAFGSLAALCVLVVLLAMLVKYLTKNETLAYFGAGGLLVLIMGFYMYDPTKFEGLFPVGAGRCLSDPGAGGTVERYPFACGPGSPAGTRGGRGALVFDRQWVPGLLRRYPIGRGANDPHVYLQFGSGGAYLPGICFGY